MWRRSVMLTVAKVSAKVAPGYADYLEGKTRTSRLGDYYLRDGERVEAPGRWITINPALGIEANDRIVDGEVLRSLMALRHPHSGEQLRRVGASGEAVAALDATFSAPKSVSAVWALSDPQARGEVEAAHERAIDRAISYALAEVAMVRQRVDANTVSHVKAHDVIATSWRHSTARSVNGQAPDPQLHSHVLLHAAVRGDGRLVAIDSRAWLVHRREIGAAYRTELARELGALGFEIQRGTGRGGRYFEIAGIPQGLLDRWSSRHHQVHAAIQARLETSARDGLVRLSPAQERAMAVISREAKAPVTAMELDQQWTAAAADAGLDRDRIGDLRHRARVTRPAVEGGQLVSALTEFDATFSDRDARAVALERSAGASIEDALLALEHARKDGQILRLADGHSTTTIQRRSEQAVVAGTARLVDGEIERLSPIAVDTARARLNQDLARYDSHMSDEQERALQLATGYRQVVMIEGQAGTGKSTVLQAVGLAHQAEGREVIITSTGALAAQRLADDFDAVEVAASAYSTVALTHAVSAGSRTLDEHSTIIHDEAALASTREQLALLAMVQASGARLIIVGDPKQSQPVGAGGLWEHIEDILSEQDARVQLTQNLRAEHEADRRDQQLFRDGQHHEALAGYGSRNRIRSRLDQSSTEHDALRAAHQDRQNGKQTLVIAQTSNDHLDELNAHAQALRLHDRELGESSLPIPGRPYRLHAGDHVQVRHSIQLPDRQLQNGSTAVVAQIDENRRAARLRLDDREEIDLDETQLEQADVRLAYVQHPFPAQGVTTDTAHLIVGEHATREGTYVAITRPREEAHIHVSWDSLTDKEQVEPWDRLVEILGRAEPEVPSIATPLAHEQEIESEQARALNADGRSSETSYRLVPGSFSERHRRQENGRQAAPLQPEAERGWEL